MRCPQCGCALQRRQ